MAASISSLLVDCFRSFTDLLSSRDLDKYDAEVRKELWQDELGRLRVWAANIGAHQTGQSSLDFRLRDASHIKEQVMKLLRRVQGLFADLDEVMNEAAFDDNDQEFDDEDETEIQQIYRGLVDTTTCLFQMSITVRRPADHDRLMGTKREYAIFFEPHDRQHVSDKFSRADSEIVERLGTAISRRRAALAYRAKHKEKLQQGIDRVFDHHPDTVSTIFSETVATEYNNNPEPTFEDTASYSGVSQTSYAQTLLHGDRGISIPPPPKESADGTPFECPYCYFIITIRNQRDWSRHIFTDLMPYICIFPNCSTPNKLYSSRRHWYCHLQTVHSVASPSGAIFNCPLCTEAIPSNGHIDRHIGRHLEELALFALPRTGMDEDADSNASNRPFDQRSADDISQSSDEESEESESVTYTLSIPPLSPSAESTFDPDPVTMIIGGVEIMLPTSKHQSITLKSSRRARDKESDSNRIETKEDLEPLINEAVKNETAEKGWLTPNMKDAKAKEKGMGQNVRIDSESKKDMDNTPGGKATDSEEDIISQSKAEKIGSETEHPDPVSLNPMYTKVHTRELSPETLNAFKIPWDWDDISAGYIVIKTEINEELRDDLFQHTRMLRQTEQDVTPENEVNNFGQPKPEEEPIRFKDAGMESLIRQAFVHVDVIGPHVNQGHYDLISNGQIILPQVWESIIEPGWSITMHMWPVMEPTAPSPPIIPDDS
ncbi:hypothetical protein FQN50_006145 [Emmonsiellopsis sp. PD_5]|nr:hypothetical protein FQN50_006145 [Emmonsiellopsis sp. PD_5]